MTGSRSRISLFIIHHLKLLWHREMILLCIQSARVRWKVEGLEGILAPKTIFFFQHVLAGFFFSHAFASLCLPPCISLSFCLPLVHLPHLPHQHFFFSSLGDHHVHFMVLGAVPCLSLLTSSAHHNLPWRDHHHPSLAFFGWRTTNTTPSSS